MNAPFFTHGLLTGNEGLIFALVVGIFFGFFLERGGLGSARKLAAQFYLTDLAVFKIMFTAIITAMVGLSLLSIAGFVDIAHVYVSPTFLMPQAIGGLIFGIGFILGGYCPGTACVASSTGKLDGIVHLFGMMTGILLFGETFPLYERFYYSTSMGQITLQQVFDVPAGMVVIAVVLLAIGGFVVAEKLERVNAGRQSIGTHE